MSARKLFIISGKNPISAGSGYAAYAYSLAKIARDVKWEVMVFCAGDQDKEEKTEIGTVVTVSSPFWKWFSGVEMAALVLLAPVLARAMANKRGEDKIVVWGAGPWSLAGALLKLVKPVYLVADYHTTFRHEFAGTVKAMRVEDYGLWLKLRAVVTYLTVIPTYGLIEKWVLRMTDKIITHYDSTEKILQNEMGIGLEKMVRLPYRVEASRAAVSRKFQKMTFKVPLVLLVCRHDGRKGINYLLRAFKVLNDKKVPFQAKIIGGGRLLETNRKLASKRGLTNVEVEGYVADLRPYLATASVYVFPSVEEGSSALAVLEAMKWGLPIVSTRVDGLQEDIQDGRSGLLVPPQNPEALAQAVEKLLRNKKQARQFGLAAKERYEKLYGDVIVTKAVGNFLARVFPEAR